MSTPIDNRFRRRAAAAVFVAVILPLLIAFVALVVDLGSLHMARAELQNAADSAVLAGVQNLRGASPDAFAAHAAAVSYIELNQVLGQSLGPLDYVLNVDVGEVQVDADGTNPVFWLGGAANALRVTLQYEHQYNFAQIFGFQSKVFSASGTAGLVERGPIAFWRLADIVGITAVDETGDHDGTYVGAVALGMAGVFSGSGNDAVKFNGGSEFVEVPHSDDFLMNNGAVSLWFNPQNVNNVNQNLISKDSSGYDSGGHFDVRQHDTHIHVRLQSATVSYHLTSPVGSILNSGQWYHLVVSFGVDGLKLFINGNEADSDPYAGGWGTTSGGAGNYEPITIGVGQQSSGNQTSAGWNRPFTGRIDEVAIYDRGVSQSEAQWLYEAVLNDDVTVGAIFWDGILRF